MSTICRFGATAGLAIMTIIRNEVQKRHSGLGQREAEWKGLQAAFWATTACLLVGALSEDRCYYIVY